MPAPSTFVARLSVAIEVVGVSYNDLDKRIATLRGAPQHTPGYTSRVMGGRDVPLSFALDYAIALGVRPAWLLAGDGEMLPDAHTALYSDLPGWRIVAAGAVDLLPPYVPPYAIEAVAQRPVLAQPRALTPAFVAALAEFWLRYADESEISAAAKAHASSRAVK